MKFINSTLFNYNKLKEKDSDCLYFIYDKRKIFKGETPLNKDIIILNELPLQGKYNNLYLVKEKLYIWHKTYEEQLKKEKIVEKWLCLNEVSSKLDETTNVNTTVKGDIVKQYIDNQFEHAPIYVDAKNVKYKNVNHDEILTVQDAMDFVLKIL